MAESKRKRRKSGLRWVLTGGVALLLAVMLTLGYSYLAPRPTPQPPAPIVKVMPPEPPPPKAFLAAEDQGLEILPDETTKESQVETSGPTPSVAAVPSTPSPQAQSTDSAAQKSVSKSAFTIHLESFRSEISASKRVQFLQSLDLEAFSRAVDLPEKGIFHRVFVGRFPDREQAEKVQTRLQKEYELPGGRIVSISFAES